MEAGTQPRMQCENAVLVGSARLQRIRQVVVALADGGPPVPQQGGDEADMVRIVQGHAGRRRMAKMVHRHPPGKPFGREPLDPVGKLDQPGAPAGDPQMLNPCGSHSPPLAALIARVSETDVLLTTGRRLAHLYNTPPLGAGILYSTPCWISSRPCSSV